MSHGVFISYKRSHKHLAGRIFDFLYNHGLNPFMDEYSIHQAPDYREVINEEILASPYFLLLLTPDGLADLEHEAGDYYNEVQTAFSHGKKVLVITYGDVDYNNMTELPESISKLRFANRYKLPEENRLFPAVMNDLYKNDIDIQIVLQTANWKNYISCMPNVLLLPRDDFEKSLSSFENRFGRDFIKDIIENNVCTDHSKVKEINMSCYAANLMFLPERSMIDRKAFDKGQMSAIIERLLLDHDFYFRIIINAPSSVAAADAKKYEKLGNSSLEDLQDAVFYGSYAKINELIARDPYKTAYKQRRFLFFLTDCCIPYSIFQVIYKDAWSEFNHIKVDLYSYGVDSSQERLCMILFQNDLATSTHYSFFDNQFKYLLKKCRSDSKTLIEANHSDWISKWREMEEALQ